MSFKSIDMSIAVHKNPDVGQIQRDLLQKQVSDQAALAQAGTKTDTERRQKASGLEETDKSQIRDRQKGQGGPGQGGQENGASAGKEKRDHPTKAADSSHPYKGHHIDLSL